VPVSVRTVNCQASCGTTGVGPAERTGKPVVSYCPGGSVCRVSRARPWNPRETMDMSGPPSAERAASIFQQMVRRSISAGGNAGTYPCRPSNHGRTGRYRTGLQRSLTGVRCPRPLWSVTSVATTTRAHCTGQKGVHMLRKQGTTILGATALVLAGVVGGAAPAQAAPVQITAGGTAPACIQRSVVNNPDGGMQAWL